MKYGFGKHLWDVRAADMLVYAKLFSPLGITYCWAPALTKISTLLLSVFPGSTEPQAGTEKILILPTSFHRLNSARNFRIALYCVGFLTLAYSLATTFVIPIACDPSDPSKANCTNAIGTSQSAVNIFTDVVVLILPIPMLRNLQMPVFQKVVLGCVFGIGSLVVVVSVVRLYFNLTYLTAVDNTWYIAKSGILSSVEVNCAVVCNCIVVLKPLLRKVFPSLLSTPKTPNNYKSSQTPGKGFSKISRSKNSAIELSSVEAGTYHEDDGDISGRRIMVTKSYHVQGHNDDSESMENIIEPDRKFPHYHR
ncbi:hypothetical protein FQN50_002764 [Emmonsiellopsis sp. PD_5]|nr:hypothetical protein FQN50_002764 [Emmonsiellopsis sp. PD_5]